MTSNPTSRRSLLGGLLASIFAPLAGMFGGRARANDAIDRAAIERYAGTLKPAPIGAASAGEYQYRYVIEEAISGSRPRRAVCFGPCAGEWHDLDTGLMMFQHYEHLAREFGGRVRFERRRVIAGPIELVETVESRVHRTGEPCRECDGVVAAS